MKKQTIAYSSPLDAMVEMAKRLSVYETAHHMNSEDFFDRYSRGELSDDLVFIEWANDYRHYLSLRRDLEKKLENAA